MKLRLTVNRVAGSIIREETVDGVKYIVVPIVAMVEGVHQGLSGPNIPGPRSYYPASILAQIAATLEGKPVTVDHPMTTTQLVSASSPEGAPFCVGTMKDVTVEGTKIKGEAWIDSARLSRVSPTGLSKIESGQPFDVSLGAMIAVTPVAGIWNNEAYDEVITGLTSDHLAILPNNSGACSWNDGCGIRAAKQANQPEGKEHTMKNKWSALARLMGSGKKVATKDNRVNELIANASNPFTEDDREFLSALDEKALVFIANEISHDEISSKLWDFVNGLDSPQYYNFLRKVYDGYFIYNTQPREGAGAGRSGSHLYKRTYTVDQANNNVTVGEEAIEVIEKIEYVPVEQSTANSNPNRETAMSKEQLIANIIACDRNPYVEDDRSVLNAMSECQLKRVLEFKPADNAAPKGEGAPAAPATQATPVANAAVESENEMTVDEYLDKAPKPIANQLRSALDREQKAKDDLITKLAANKDCAFTADELKAKDLSEIQKIAAMVRVPVDHVDYSGQVGAPRGNAESKMPKMPSSLAEPEKA